jgi:hypothetical protein
MQNLDRDVTLQEVCSEFLQLSSVWNNPDITKGV